MVHELQQFFLNYDLLDFFLTLELLLLNHLKGDFAALGVDGQENGTEATTAQLSKNLVL